jgi:hypothetical protein
LQCAAIVLQSFRRARRSVLPVIRNVGYELQKAGFVTTNKPLQIGHLSLVQGRTDDLLRHGKGNEVLTVLACRDDLRIPPAGSSNAVNIYVTQARRGRQHSVTQFCVGLLQQFVSSSFLQLQSFFQVPRSMREYDDIPVLTLNVGASACEAGLSKKQTR